MIVARADGSEAQTYFNHFRARITDLRFAPDDHRVSFRVDFNGRDFFCIATLGSGALDCPLGAEQLTNLAWRP